MEEKELQELIKKYELKSCPFCGKKAKPFFIHKHSFYIGCTNGCAKTKTYSILHKKPEIRKFEIEEKVHFCVEHWNRRTE